MQGCIILALSTCAFFSLSSQRSSLSSQRLHQNLNQDDGAAESSPQRGVFLNFLKLAAEPDPETRTIYQPLRNLVNSCIAVTVARGLQLPKLPLVAAALGGLVVYDTVSVYGTGGLVAPAAGFIRREGEREGEREGGGESRRKGEGLERSRKETKGV